MALEKKWGLVPPQPFIADGTQFGQITIANTAGFKTKQSAYLTANGLPDLPVQVKRVLSPTTLIVGTINNAQIASWKPLDITAYTVANNAAVGAEIQDKNNAAMDDIFKAVYESDPTVALRVIFTDQYGNLYSDENPLPATFTGTISVGEVIIKGTNGNTIEPNPDGSLNVNISDQPINVHIVDSPTAGETVISKYNEVFNVASGVQTTIVTYTVPALKTAILERVNTSGQNVGRYDVFLNGSPFDTQITYFGGSFNAWFDYTTGNNQGYLLNAGDVITITILHNRPFIGNFTARLQVLEIS